MSAVPDHTLTDERGVEHGWQDAERHVSIPLLRAVTGSSVHACTELAPQAVHESRGPTSVGMILAEDGPA